MLEARGLGGHGLSGPMGSKGKVNVSDLRVPKITLRRHSLGLLIGQYEGYKHHPHGVLQR